MISTCNYMYTFQVHINKTERRATKTTTIKRLRNFQHEPHAGSTGSMMNLTASERLDYASQRLPHLAVCHLYSHTEKTSTRFCCTCVYVYVYIYIYTYHYVCIYDMQIIENYLHINAHFWLNDTPCHDPENWLPFSLPEMSLQRPMAFFPTRVIRGIRHLGVNMVNIWLILG